MSKAIKYIFGCVLAHASVTKISPAQAQPKKQSKEQSATEMAAQIAYINRINNGGMPYRAPNDWNDEQLTALQRNDLDAFVRATDKRTHAEERAKRERVYDLNPAELNEAQRMALEKIDMSAFYDATEARKKI